MKWIKNLEMIASNSESGICPYCNSEKTEYGLIVDDEKTMMGHGAIWCNDCKRAFIISRIKVDKKHIRDIPSDLVF